MISLVLLVIGALCFLLAALKVPTNVNFIAWGLFCVTIAAIIAGYYPRIVR